MTPKLWTYLSLFFLRIFCLCLFSFICLLIVIRAQQIAKFAAISSSYGDVFFFILYQLPYILPFATSLSVLMGSYMLTKHLSSSRELTTLRSCGISIKKTLIPIFIILFYISLLNFYMISELSPVAKRESKDLVSSTFNHISKEAFKNEGFFKKFGLTAIINHETKTLIGGYSTQDHDPMTLIIAEKMSVSENNLILDDLTLITSKKENNLTIETINKSSIELSQIGSFNSKKRAFSYEDLKGKECLIHLITRSFDKIGVFEILKRTFFLLTPISFGFLGLGYGLTIGREPKSRYFSLTLLTIFLFSSYFIGKSLDHHPLWAGMTFIIPQLIVIYLSLTRIHLIEKGYEI